MSKLLFKLNLQHFSEGAPEEGEGTGEGTVDAAQEEPVVLYGKQKETGDEEETPPEEPPKPTFDELIEGDYKEDFNKKMQSIVQNRIKNVKGSEESLRALEPVLQSLAEKYGVEDSTDIKSLVEAFTNDDSLYEEEAQERGIDVETLKNIKKLERQNAEFAREMERRERETENAQAWQEVLRQAEEAKEIYPNLDIKEEMQNDDFAHLVAVNVPVKTAFEVVHHDELQAMSAKVIADQTARRVANSVKANRKRVGEGQGTTPVVVKKDFTKLTDEERDDVYERVMAGEEIYL